MIMKQENELVLLCIIDSGRQLWRSHLRLPSLGLPILEGSWGGFRNAFWLCSAVSHMSLNRSNGMTIPNVYAIVYFWITITFREEGLTSIDHTKQHPGDIPLRCLLSQPCCSISRAAGLGWKWYAHWPWLPAQGEQEKCLRVRKAQLPLTFIRRMDIIAAGILHLKKVLLLYLVLLSHFVLVLQVRQICTSVSPHLSLSLQHAQYLQPPSLLSIEQLLSALESDSLAFLYYETS